MRRKDKEITEREEIEDILKENNVARLATSINDVPYVVPINYVYENGKIYFHSHKDGKKMQNIIKNPRVCFEVDSGELWVRGEKPCDCTWRFRSVIIDGEAILISDPEKRLIALRALSEKYTPGRGKLLLSEDLEKLTHLLLVEIKINGISGKKSPPKAPTK